MTRPRRGPGCAARGLRLHDQRCDVRHPRRHDGSPCICAAATLRSTFIAAGGYAEPVAELLFNTINGPRLFHGVRLPTAPARAAATGAEEGATGERQPLVTSNRRSNQDEIKRPSTRSSSCPAQTSSAFRRSADLRREAICWRKKKNNGRGADDRGNRRRSVGTLIPQRFSKAARGGEESPFRADHVGGPLRPKAIHEARAQRTKGQITAARA